MTSEMYTTVCRERFQSNDNKLAVVCEDTQYLRRKIDNGLSSMPGQMDKMEAQQRKVIGGIISVGVSFLIMMLAGSGIWLYTFGRFEERLENHITDTEPVIERMIEGDIDG